MTNLASQIETLFWAKHPVNDTLGSMIDECSIVRPSTVIEDESLYGHDVGASTTPYTGIPCRMEPVIGRLNRIKDVFHTNVIDADYIVWMPYQDDYTEKDDILVTSSDNAQWLNNAFDTVLVMDIGGQHKVTAAALKEKRQ